MTCESHYGCRVQFRGELFRMEPEKMKRYFIILASPEIKSSVRVTVLRTFHSSVNRRASPHVFLQEIMCIGKIAKI